MITWAMSAAVQDRRRVLLLVDDEPDIRITFRALVEQVLDDVRVLVAATGQEALDILEVEHVDAVVSDYRMPGMDGFELLKEVKQTHPEVPRLMFTAFANEEQLEEAMAEGTITGFLPKSIHPEAFLDRVKGLLSDAPLAAAKR